MWLAKIMRRRKYLLFCSLCNNLTILINLHFNIWFCLCLAAHCVKSVRIRGLSVQVGKYGPGRLAVRTLCQWRLGARFYFRKGDWGLGFVSTRFWDSFNISQFPEDPKSFFFLCGQSPAPAAKIRWGYLSSKNERIQYKRFSYTIYTTQYIKF